MIKHAKSFVVIIMALLMAISAPDAFAQGKITRHVNPVNPVKPDKPGKKKQKQKTQTKPKPAPQPQKPKQEPPNPKPQPQKPKQESKPLTGSYNGHDWVDLGLPSGLKWATCNVGASSPEDYGDYFAWGDTRTKSEYGNVNSVTFGKSTSELRSAGIINSSGILTKSYDAASCNWGSLWRMPTQAEMEELVNKCTLTWTTQRGYSGYKVTGPNGNSIFLPAAGRRYSSLKNAGEIGYCWSSSVGDDTFSAYILYFDSGYHDVSWNYRYRGLGLSVRPVSE